MEKKFADIKNSPTLAEEFENDLIESYNFLKNEKNSAEIHFTRLYNRMERTTSYPEEGKHQWSLPRNGAGNEDFRNTAKT